MTDGVIVIGAGGHAKVCIEVLRSAGSNVAFCVSSGAGAATCLGVRVLTGDDQLPALRRQGFRHAFVAIGDNTTRRLVAGRATESGFQLVNAVSPLAVVSPSARLGLGVAMMPGSIVNAESAVHDLAIINTGATVDHDCTIGVAAHLGPQCALAGNVRVGAQALLGIGCTVIPWITIGDRAIVGAGGVVIRDVGDDVITVGVPATAIDRSGHGGT